MRSVAGLLNRPLQGCVGAHDDDVVACVLWRAGHVQAAWAAGIMGNGRAAAWISHAAGTVCEADPLAVLTAGELGG